jgi:hypothetical protein
MAFKHPLHPLAWNKESSQRVSLEYVGTVHWMGENRCAENDGIPPLQLVEHLDFPDDTRNFCRMPLNVSIVINSVLDSNAIQPGTQVNKDNRLTTSGALSANHPAEQSPRIIVESDPAVRVGFLIE